MYCRLSRDDGDKAESDSIQTQAAMLTDYVRRQEDLKLFDVYCDDGFTGTNFDRPAFRRLWADIEAGRVNCVLVKDLSRFGRDYIDVGRYLERIFPAAGVRFIALGERIDSQKSAYDLMLPLKNVFNEQYARDISQKVKSAFLTKRRKGEFVGAFASYGYRKDPADRHHLLIDPVAAAVVRRIFTLYENGMGKLAIAKLLNKESLPCPSVYKEQSGARYTNGQRLSDTSYWTYATIHRMLKNAMYTGHMEQGRSHRPVMHGKAKQLPQADWTRVADTHEAIIEASQWARVQALLRKDTRSIDFERNLSPFAGFLRCGDCGRAMSKSCRSNTVRYSCGSYKRYGVAVCSAHDISHGELEALVLEDLNRLIAAVPNLGALAQTAAREATPKAAPAGELAQLTLSLSRIRRLKKRSYEDYAEGLLGREAYLQYRQDYERQEAQLCSQIGKLEQAQREPHPPETRWVDELLAHGGLTSLDRSAMAELIHQLLIFADGRLEIQYRFALPAG